MFFPEYSDMIHRTVPDELRYWEGGEESDLKRKALINSTTLILCGELSDIMSTISHVDVKELVGRLMLSLALLSRACEVEIEFSKVVSIHAPHSALKLCKKIYLGDYDIQKELNDIANYGATIVGYNVLSDEIYRLNLMENGYYDQSVTRKDG